LGNRRGAILLLIAVSMVALMGLVVIAIDGGKLQNRKRLTQTAADAAALAGAIEKWRGRPDSVIPSAKSEANRNYFNDGTGGITVDVDPNPSTGNFTGPDFVTVLVSKRWPSVFAGFFGIDSVMVRAQAVAGVAPDTRTCLVALDPTASKAIDVGPNGSIDASGCGVVVNSNADDALYVKGNADLTGGSIAVTGGVDPSGGGPISPTPSTGAPPTPDPLAYLTMPTVPNTCDFTPSGTYQTAVTLSPGTYCGNIDVQNGTVTLNPGVYFMRGATLRVRANSTLTTAGAGVNIVMTDSAGNYGIVDFASNALVTLSACTVYDAATCPLAGVLFYQGPNAPADVVNEFGSGADSFLNGTLYFPTQIIHVKSGGTNLTIDGALICSQVVVESGSTLNMAAHTGGSPYSPLKRATIVQ